MNTGIQCRRHALRGVTTTTRWPGIKGNSLFKKDIAIVADHNVPYVATLSVAHSTDLVQGPEGQETKGFRFLHCLTPAPRSDRAPRALVKPPGGGHRM